MRRFVVKLYLFTLFAHAPFAAVVWCAAEGCAWWLRGLIALALSVSSVVLFHGRFRLLIDDRPVAAWRMALFEEPYFVHYGALVFGFPVAVLAATSSILLPLGWEQGLALGYLGGLPIALYAVVVRRRWVVVRETEVCVEGLPKAFDGYRIVQLSDIHVGAFHRASRGKQWVRRALDARPDLIALTGDYVTSGTRFHHEIAELLAPLHAPDGVWAVMGNHDYFGDGEPLMTLMRERGIRFLRNERAEVSRGGQSLALVGVEDVFTKRADVNASFLGHGPAECAIVLAHDPIQFDKIAERTAGIVLSGHTHWGQVALPFFARSVNFAQLTYRYHAGVHRKGSAVLFIHPGIGTTGPPLRLGAPPEVSVLVLRASAT